MRQESCVRVASTYQGKSASAHVSENIGDVFSLVAKSGASKYVKKFDLRGNKSMDDMAVLGARGQSTACSCGIFEAQAWVADAAKVLFAFFRCPRTFND